MKNTIKTFTVINCKKNMLIRLRKIKEIKIYNTPKSVITVFYIISLNEIDENKNYNIYCLLK